MSEIKFVQIPHGFQHPDMFADGEHVYVVGLSDGDNLVLGHDPERGLCAIGDETGECLKWYGPELRALAREYPEIELQGTVRGYFFEAYDVRLQGEPVSYQHPAWTHLDWLRIDTAPILYSGPHYPTILEDHNNHNIIIRPLEEADHPTLGRKILQYAKDAKVRGTA